MMVIKQKNKKKKKRTRKKVEWHESVTSNKILNKIVCTSEMSMEKSSAKVEKVKQRKAQIFFFIVVKTV